MRKSIAHELTKEATSDFERNQNACWAYITGAAIAIKKGCIIAALCAESLPLTAAP